ncbi:MAG: PspC domain-containing protein [Raoultibacter sp.]
MNKKNPQQSTAAQIGILAGAVLIFFGIIKLLEHFFGSSWWGTVERVWSTFLSFAWPIALIGIGVYVVWAAKTGKFKRVSIDTTRPLRRSQLDKRILGVCGGIAAYVNVDSIIVRVIAIVLLVVSPWFTLIMYFIAAILMPKS